MSAARSSSMVSKALTHSSEVAQSAPVVRPHRHHAHHLLRHLLSAAWPQRCEKARARTGKVFPFVVISRRRRRAKTDGIDGEAYSAARDRSRIRRGQPPEIAGRYPPPHGI